MSEEEGRKKAVFPSPFPSRRPERPEERRWPSPTPMPLVPTENIDKVIKQILNRLDAIEKRLERIEKMLMAKQLPV
ncbi:MAG: hypothetical protein OEY39_08205 [Candidatus Bathyarchaeota archaeon]|nr:hypothetical protein [Candidatus Bathyarchaeota archaeon]MDH5624433.1 hypothetical protein [Candidatus Bathyarchaeota archaeon]MDH5635273.1 hypothetical protein [Candidatus Bathyarchaeota archaeon]MDH5701621.1 hypothetical protein [Candidatus Bathyarchaeota archaeon]